MKEKTVLYLSDEEEELVDILAMIGIKKTVAKVLVFLANTANATSRVIELGVDLRQPEVSIALKDLTGRGWVTFSEIPSEQKGRPYKLFTLAVPVGQIVASIEKRTEDEMERQLRLVRKMRNYA